VSSPFLSPQFNKLYMIQHRCVYMNYKFHYITDFFPCLDLCLVLWFLNALNLCAQKTVEGGYG
jgi:hypothetical protein